MLEFYVESEVGQSMHVFDIGRHTYIFMYMLPVCAGT